LTKFYTYEKDHSYMHIRLLLPATLGPDPGEWCGKGRYGLELIGVNVVQRGTFIGTVTDIEGRFSLVLDDGQSRVLQITYIGYETLEIDVSSRSYVEVTLYEMAVGLEEVVVVGFATQQKASLTGSIANVGSQELRETPVSSVTNALTGRVPGLITRQESGRPGGDAARMFIRGRASLNDSDPLVLVDGVERNFNQIDVEDIESISVLKDASATAVYGVRGANGVILVTTKRGRIGRPRISFSSEYGMTEL
jgi:TonB-dependent SusC/RagA subfamily outer membrane receptor